MPQLKPAFMFLKAEMESRKDVHNGGLLVPWDWPGTPGFFKFRSGREDTAYPVLGMCSISRSRDNPDIAEFVNGDSNWKAFQAFMQAFESEGRDNKKLCALSVNSKKNAHRVGAKIFANYFSKITKRGNQNRIIDMRLRELKGAPYQLYKARKRDWPPSKKDEKEPVIKVEEAVSSCGEEFMRITFGDECIGEDGADQETLDICKALFTASWMRQNTRGRSAIPKAIVARDAKDAARKAVFSLEGKTPEEKVELVNKWAKAVVQYRKTVEWMSAASEVNKMNEEQDEIRSFIMQAKDGKSVNKRLQGLEKVFEGMNDPELVARMEDDYASAFEDLLEDADDINDVDLSAMIDEAGELGVAEFRDKSIEQLRTLLGLEGRDISPVFPFFNAWVSDIGKLPEDIDLFEDIAWNDEKALTHPDKLRPLRPLWHQYVGLAAMVRRFYNGENVLLADGVGVGKTMECFMVMAYMRHLRLLNSLSNPIKPPIVTTDTQGYWGWNSSGRNYVPTGHILVAVPGMLIHQWEEEAHRFLDRRFWNIVIYPTRKKLIPEFWMRWEAEMERGTQETKRDMTTILLVSYSTLRMEASAALDPKVKKINTVSRAEGPGIVRGQSTVFSREWALIVFDEAQHLRTEGTLVKAAHALRIRSASMILATATPLHNAEKDLVFLGCAMDCPEASQLVQLGAELDTHIKKLQKVQKELLEDEREQVQDRGTLAMKGVMSNHPLEKERTRIRLEYVRKMRDCFGKTIIRRTRRSKDNNGNSINGLEEREDVDFVIEMRDDEREVFKEIINRTSEQINTQTNFASLPTKLFFTEYRRGISNVRFAQRSYPDPWKSLEHYQADNSTKWRVIFKLIHHLLKSDSEPFPYYDKGKGELVTPEKPDDLNAKSKIVVYLEFTSLLEVFLQACRFEGITALCATGRSPTKKRTEAITQFMTDPKSRVLILSSVGNAGLNLHAARFMIFADCVWSGQAEEQIIGRIHRQPNKQKVIVYHPRVAETSDIVLRKFARSKETLLDTFLGKFIDPANGMDEAEKELEEIEQEEDIEEERRARESAHRKKAEREAAKYKKGMEAEARKAASKNHKSDEMVSSSEDEDGSDETNDVAVVASGAGKGEPTGSGSVSQSKRGSVLKGDQSRNKSVRIAPSTSGASVKGGNGVTEISRTKTKSKPKARKAQPSNNNSHSPSSLTTGTSSRSSARSSPSLAVGMRNDVSASMDIDSGDVTVLASDPPRDLARNASSNGTNVSMEVDFSRDTTVIASSATASKMTQFDDAAPSSQGESGYDFTQWNASQQSVGQESDAPDASQGDATQPPEDFEDSVGHNYDNVDAGDFARVPADDAGVAKSPLPSTRQRESPRPESKSLDVERFSSLPTSVHSTDAISRSTSEGATSASSRLSKPSKSRSREESPDAEYMDIGSDDIVDSKRGKGKGISLKRLRLDVGEEGGDDGVVVGPARRWARDREQRQNNTIVPRNARTTNRRLGLRVPKLP